MSANLMSRLFTGRALCIVPLAIAIFPATTCADDEATTTDPTDINTGSFHFEFGVDWLSKYYFRGIIQQDEGLIIQPWFDISVDLAKFDNGSMGMNFGIWNSFHEEDKTTSSPSSWYEADLYAGLSLDIYRWSIGPGYTYYSSPNNTFGDVDEFGFSVGYDDSGHWGDDSDFAFNPYATVAFETGDNAADGGETGIYLELGIEPAFTWDNECNLDLEISVPVTVGLSLDDYYENGAGEDETFGYLDLGVNATLGLPVPANYGAWSLSAGVGGLWLGEHTQGYNSDNDDFEVIAHLGLSISY